MLKLDLWQADVRHRRMGATLPRALTCAEVNARRAVDPEVADIEELAR